MLNVPPLWVGQHKLPRSANLAHKDRLDYNDGWVVIYCWGTFYRWRACTLAAISVSSRRLPFLLENYILSFEGERSSIRYIF